MKIFARVLFAIWLTFALPSVGSTHSQAPVTSTTLSMFSTESAAQAHCPKDEVVGLNTNTGIYHEKGMRWYGRTKTGAYVCRADADAAADRDTRNGQ